MPRTNLYERSYQILTENQSSTLSNRLSFSRLMRYPDFFFDNRTFTRKSGYLSAYRARSVCKPIVTRIFFSITGLLPGLFPIASRYPAARPNTRPAGRVSTYTCTRPPGQIPGRPVIIPDRPPSNYVTTRGSGNNPAARVTTRPTG